MADIRAARAVVRGPLHIFSEADPAFATAVGRPIIGIPRVEAFAESIYDPFGELYDWARRHRQPVAFIADAPDGGCGIVTLEPLPEDGLAVWWEPVPASPRSNGGLSSLRVTAAVRDRRRGYIR